MLRREAALVNQKNMVANGCLVPLLATVWAAAGALSLCCSSNQRSEVKLLGVKCVRDSRGDRCCEVPRLEAAVRTGGPARHHVSANWFGQQDVGVVMCLWAGPEGGG